MAALVVAITGVTGAAARSAPQATGPVDGSVRHAYHPAAPGAASVDIADYDGPLLELQATDLGIGAGEPTIRVA